VTNHKETAVITLLAKLLLDLFICADGFHERCFKKWGKKSWQWKEKERKGKRNRKIAKRTV